MWVVMYIVVITRRYDISVGMYIAVVPNRSSHPLSSCARASASTARSRIARWPISAGGPATASRLCGTSCGAAPSRARRPGRARSWRSCAVGRMAMWRRSWGVCAGWTSSGCWRARPRRRARWWWRCWCTGSSPPARTGHGPGLAEATRTSTLSLALKLPKVDEDDLYAALDWLLVRQGAIEQALARRHSGRAVGALRRDLDVLRGAPVPVGQAGSSGTEAGHAADRVRRADECGGVPGGRRGVRRQHGGYQDASPPS